MRILLTALPVHDSGDNASMHLIPPPAIYTLASLLREAGQDVIVVDPAEYRKIQPIDERKTEFRNLLKSVLANVDVVGISSNTTNWGMSLYAINEIHSAFPEISIVVGGVHAAYFDKYILSSTPTSYVIRGEGEVALLELLEAIEKKQGFENILGLTWKASGGIVQNPARPWQNESILANAPLPAYDMLPDKEYYTLPIDTSRGCLYGCRFCSVPRRSNWFGWDPHLAVARIKNSIEKFGDKFNSKTMLIVDDCFTADTGRSIKILKEMRRLNLDWTFMLEARATDLLKDGLIEAIPKTLIKRLAIGVECGYDEGLSRINKGLTMEKLYMCLDKLQEAGVTSRVFLSFIIGFPWETEQDCLRTVHTAAKLVYEYGVAVNLNWLILYPSKLWFENKNYGIELDETVFDDPTYLWNEKYFYLTHPTITPEIRRRVDETINGYLNSGCLIKSP